VKAGLASISLAVCIALFFLGFLLLCFCPGWYLVAAAFAGIAVWLGAPKTRFWGAFWIVGSLTVAGVHVYGKSREQERIREHRRHNEERQRTNRVEQTNAQHEKDMSSH